MATNHNCKDLVSSISEYVDGSLSESLCVELEKHLSECENCRVVVNTLRKTIEIYQEQPVEEKMPDDVRKRLFYRLDLSDFTEKNRP